MANREHLGLKATVIVLSMLFIAVSVSTYVFYRKAQENSRLAEASDKSKKEIDQKFTNENYKVQFVLHVLGIEMRNDVEFNQAKQAVVADENMKKVDGEYEKYKKMFQKSLPEGQQFSILQLPEILMTALRSKSEQIIDRDAEINKLRADTKTAIDSENQARRLAEEALKKANDDLIVERDTFNKDRDAILQKQVSQETNYQKLISAKKAEVEAAVKAVDQKEKDKQKIEKTNKDLEERIASLQPNVFEVAHGRIVWVNQATHTVWINLGLADGLRRQITFSVFDHESSGIKDAKQKGSIEVTQVLDQHLAEGRILDETDIKNPLMPGDQVFSPAWRPGRRVRFALVGTIDINGDGYSDRDLVRSLITMNGGVIDAEVHDDGQLVGNISPQTNYLVLGQSPALQRVPNEVALKEYNRIFEEARNAAIQRISIDELLNLMGWKGGLKTISLGRGASSDDFKAKPADGVIPESTGNTSGIFKERTPPKGNDGAF